MDRIGTVVEGASPQSFRFQADTDVTVPLHEYVVVDVDEYGVGTVQVLGEIVNVNAVDPLARPGMAGDRTYPRPAGYTLMEVEVLGYKKEGRLIRPKTAPRPNSPVYRAEDHLLKEFFKGEEDKIPIEVGNLVNRPKVPVRVHLQDLEFHLAILAMTRAGKSYLAGKIMEEILRNTNFPVIAIDFHGDYVMMDWMAEGNDVHGEFDVVVYYPPGAPRVPGVTAKQRTLNISPKQIPHRAFCQLLGPELGSLQRIELRNAIEKLSKKGDFGIEDLIDMFREKIENEKSTTKEKERLATILMRLEDLKEDIPLGREPFNVEELLRPKTLSVICLRGLRSRIQDTYVGMLVDLLFRHLVENSGDPAKAPPTFLFIEEAHRVASKGGSRYAVRAVSTAIREGAKFGLFITLISQRPRSIDPDILANVGNYAVLKIVNSQDQSMIESASESFSQRLVGDLPSLNRGEAVLVGPFTPLPVQIKVGARMTVHKGVTPRLRELDRVIGETLERARRERW